MKKHIEMFSTTFVEAHNEDTDPLLLWNIIKSNCNYNIWKHVPTKQSSTRFSQPWVTQRVKCLSRKKKRAYARAKSINDAEAWKKYQGLKKQQLYECRSAYNNYVADIAQVDNQKLGRLIKNSRAEQAGIPTLKNNTGKHTEPRAKADILNQQFASVFSKEDSDTIPDLGTSPYPSMAKINISPKGVTKLLQSLKVNKAAGPDGITPRFLKMVAVELTPALTLLYQACINQGKVPQDLKNAYVSPLFKKGDRLSAANYRPISLTCIICKICEH